MDVCPVCKSFDTDPSIDCDYCEVDGGELVPRVYVALDVVVERLRRDRRPGSEHHIAAATLLREFATEQVPK